MTLTRSVACSPNMRASARRAQRAPLTAVLMSETFQRVIRVQSYLTGLNASISSSNEADYQEPPFKRLLQKMNEQVVTLGIHDHQFHFVKRTGSDPLTTTLFEELTSYENHLKELHVHTDDTYSSGEGFMCIPLKFETEVIGHLSFPQKGNTCLLDTETIECVAQTFMNIIKTLLLYLQQKNYADHDPLTGIANRRLLAAQAQMYVNQARRDNMYTSVCMLDLDHFKKINDTHGHHAGDLVLKAVSEALKNSLRETDILGRYGGEEFVVVMNHADKDNEGLVIRIMNAVRNVEVRMGCVTIQPKCSMGIWTKSPIETDMSSPEFLCEGLIAADTALYAAKNNGRNQFIQYSGEIHAQSILSDPNSTLVI